MASVSPAQAGISPARAGRADTTDLRETLSSPVSFSAITEDNVGQLRRLNAAILPVRYGDKFYRDVINTPLKLTKFAMWRNCVVGAICCRYEEKDERKLVYIMTLAVLPAYRGQGIGRKLLQSVLDSCADDQEVSEIYLHVHVTNTDAIAFYRKFDFCTGETIPRYYSRLSPSDGLVLRKIFSRQRDDNAKAC